MIKSGVNARGASSTYINLSPGGVKHCVKRKMPAKKIIETKDFTPFEIVVKNRMRRIRLLHRDQFVPVCTKVTFHFLWLLHVGHGKGCDQNPRFQPGKNIRAMMGNCRELGRILVGRVEMLFQCSFCDHVEYTFSGSEAEASLSQGLSHPLVVCSYPSLYLFSLPPLFLYNCSARHDTKMSRRRTDYRWSN